MAQSYSRRYTILICLGLVIATLVAFEPIRHNEFINFDDTQYVTENPHIKEGIGWESVKWAFTSSYAANWHPLTWLSHMVDYQLFGLKPLGHHLMNLLLHLVNTLLLFGVLKSMTRAIWLSALVAALFALHPLHVESVAWASERKDVLSTFFWMLTMAAYVRYARGPSIGKYILVVIIFALGLMTKPMLVTLPFVLLLLDWWPLRRVQGRGGRVENTHTDNKGFAQASVGHLIIEKIPLFVLVFGSCIVTYIVQHSGGTVAPVESFSIKLRIVNALVSYGGYLNKMVYPRGLAVIYPLAREITSLGPLILSLLQLTIISAVVFYFSRRRGYLAMGWLWYLGTLMPVIGIVQVGPQSMADRYTYIPLIGIFIMIVWGGAEILAKWHIRKIGIAIAASIILIAMLIGTRKQVGYWQNSLLLSEHALAVTQNNYRAHYSLGSAYTKRGSYPEAIDAFKQAIGIKPDYAKAHNNMGVAYLQLNRHVEALDAFRQAIGINPVYAKAHNNMGITYFELKGYSEAVASYKRAVDIKSDYAEAYNNLGIVYGAMGHYQEEIAACQEAIQLKPKYAEAYYNLGSAYANLSQYREALAAFKQAIQIKPGYEEAHTYLGIIYANRSRYPEAIEAFKQAIRIKPDYANAHSNLGVAYDKLGEYPKAIAAYKQAIGIKGDDANGHYNLGNAYLSMGNKDSAMEEYKILKKLDSELSDKLFDLINK